MARPIPAPSAPATLRGFYDRYRVRLWPALLAVALLALAAGALWSAWATRTDVAPAARWLVLGGLTAGILALAGVAALVRDYRASIRSLARLEHGQALAEELAQLGGWDYVPRGDVLSWSRGARELLGLGPGSVPVGARAFVARIHADDRERWVAAHRQTLRDGTEARVAFRFLRPDGRRIRVRSVARAERGEDGRITRLSGILQDVTAQRELAARLRRSEAKYRDLIEISSDWYWETDAAHRFTYLSPSATGAIGTIAQDASGLTRRELAGRAGSGIDWAAHEARLAAHEPFEDFVYRCLDAQGNTLWISESGRPSFDADGALLGYRGVGRDVTVERQRLLLLEIERELAQAMRELVDPDRVIDAFLRILCQKTGWSAGFYLSRLEASGRLLLRRRYGVAHAADAVASLAPTVVDEQAPEAQVAHAGRTRWIEDLGRDPGFAHRYAAPAYGARAAVIVPIAEDAGPVPGVLVFLADVPLRGDEFGTQVAEVTARMLSLFLKRSQAEERLMHASLHDPLTGLPNRVYLTHQLEGLLGRSEPVAVLYVDLDRFKIINDSLGHSMGDQVLVEIARRLRDAIRPEDVAGRIGGDEFTVLLVGTDRTEEIESIARGMLAAIEQPVVLMNRAYFLSASIGVAIAPRDGNEAKTLIRCADAAMYRVKSEGRNDVHFFAGELSRERNEALQLAAELPLALQRGEIDLYYQPVLSIGTRRLTGLEALLRWHHPEHGLLLPDRFVPVAEQSNLIRELGAWALRRALDDRIEFGLDRFDGAPVCVNVSARQLREEGFLANLNQLLQSLDFPPHLLRLELTESSLIEHPERVVRLLAEIRRLGVQVIIDSFGTGYASLAYLRNLPVDGIKIDRSFVHGIDSDRGNAAIVEAVVTLARKLGLQPMAEGVETAAELRALRNLECEVLQGELISAPLPASALKDFAESLPVLRQLHLLQGGRPEPV